MNDEKDLVTKAEAVLGAGTPVLAAGIFGLKDNYLATGLAAAGGAAVGDTVAAGPVGSVAGGAAAGAAVHETRKVLAEGQGLTVRMLVAVSATQIHVLDWVTGSGPTKELRRFDRATTVVHITKFGLSRHLSLQDTASGVSIELSGSTAFYVSEAKGDKLVLHLLTEPG